MRSWIENNVSYQLEGDKLKNIDTKPIKMQEMDKPGWGDQLGNNLGKIRAMRGGRIRATIRRARHLLAHM